MHHYIAGEFCTGSEATFYSVNPATNEVISTFQEVSHAKFLEALDGAQQAKKHWSTYSIEERLNILKNFQNLVEQDKQNLAKLISQEVGKPLWEARQEVQSLVQKIEITQHAFTIRCTEILCKETTITRATRYKPIGIIAVIGPFNFPLHLPHGHIIPALLAGNVVLYKPSEYTAQLNTYIMSLWHKAGVPKGVLSCIQGGKKSVEMIIEHPAIQGIYFTGSTAVGQRILTSQKEYPERLIALEMGGNNPIIVSTVNDIRATVYTILLSAYITSGQRCSAARRLYLIKNHQSHEIIKALVQAIQKIHIGPYTNTPEPFIGPLISNNACNKVLAQVNQLRDTASKVLIDTKRLNSTLPFLTPMLIDMTHAQPIDEEIFGPVLQLFYVDSLDEAIKKANATKFGLTASLISEHPQEWAQFYKEIDAGIINFNRPTTQASSEHPFGGIKQSGNFRPSGYFAIDSLVYPVASQESNTQIMPDTLVPGVIV